MTADQEILICDTKREELAQILDMEQGDASRLILPYSLKQHEVEFARPNIIYKSIWRDGRMIGFLILALDPDARSLEFRRIVLSETGRGYGKRVLGMIDEICRREFGRTRVWLDVFETNARARHVYEQCGYRKFASSQHNGRTLLLYEKVLIVSDAMMAK
jgi:diamine N-acetyltransferase